MSPALNGSSVIQHFEGSDAIEIRNGITFDFYTGLPHIIPQVLQCTVCSTNVMKSKKVNTIFLTFDLLSLSSRAAMCECDQLSDPHPQDHPSQLETGPPEWTVSQHKETNPPEATNPQEDWEWEVSSRRGLW